MRYNHNSPTPTENTNPTRAVNTQENDTRAPAQQSAPCNSLVRQCPGINFIVGDDGGAIIFDGGETYTESGRELCYLGSENDPTGTPVDIVEEFDCDTYSATAPLTNEHPYLVLDTAAVKSWDFGSGGGFSCGTQLVRGEQKTKGGVGSTENGYTRA